MALVGGAVFAQAALGLRAALAADLHWRGVNISQRFSLAMGGQLPLNPSDSFFTYPGSIFNPSLLAQPNTLLFWNITLYDHGAYLAGPSSQKVAGVGRSDFIATMPRFFYVLPLQPSDPHLRLFSDLVIPIETVNTSHLVHDSGASREIGVGNSGLGDIRFAPLGLYFLNVGPKDVEAAGYFAPYVVLPSGQYSASATSNLGSNEYALRFTSQWRMKFDRLWGLTIEIWAFYTHAFTNPALNLSEVSGFDTFAGRALQSYQPGDVFCANNSVQEPVNTLVRHIAGNDDLGKTLDGLTVGWAFDVLRQVNRSSLDSSPIANSLTEELAVGPLLAWQRGQFVAYITATKNVMTRNGSNLSTIWLNIIYAV